MIIKKFIQIVLRASPLAAKAAMSLASKPLLLFSVPIGVSLDKYFAAASISGVLVTISSTLLLPEVVSYLGEAYGDELELRKRTGNIICMEFIVGILALFAYFLLIIASCLSGLNVSRLFFNPILILCTFLAIISQATLEYVIRMLRLCDRDRKADTLSIAIQFCASVMPIAFVMKYGIHGYAVASMLSLIVLLVVVLNKLNIMVRPVKVEVASRFTKTSTKILPLAFSTKLFPFIEIYSIGLLGPGIYSIYSAAKSAVLGLNSIIDLGYTQRLFARYQASIRLGKYTDLLKNTRSFSASFILAFIVCIWLCYSCYHLNVVGSAISLFAADSARVRVEFAQSILLFIPLLPVSILVGVSTQVLYALQDVTYVANIACLTFVAGGAMMMVLPRSFGLAGAGIAISIYYLLNALIFSARVSRRVFCRI